MITYFGGQIKPEHKGDLVVIVRRDEGYTYHASTHLKTSREFLADVMDPPLPERVYIGVNQQATEEITRRVTGMDPSTIGHLDNLVVDGHFLGENHTKDGGYNSLLLVLSGRLLNQSIEMDH